MELNEMKSKFRELYALMSNSRDVENMKLFGSVMTSMMEDMIENEPKKAEEYINKLESIKWYNYLTREEAFNIIAHMKPSAPWDINTWNSAMRSLDVYMEKEPEYNCYALWTTMNMIYSDSGKTLASYLEIGDPDPSDDRLIKVIYHLAVDKLSDEDGVFDIRKYFDVD